ncbi:hypothetical protein QWY85_17680 [Neolewinella lacunae]|uniref:Uncharacterized protein n=1 Tax=Neolewinella lacunae TaxID=1517758 RepID=A0A923PKN3_9BACT|nr:hypothetical protein [Neolewinella lacunae]MBC6995805.1 hypothetical protein [Neolewinella lacunae]MDN3636502.1 hypothetical protein [Neolewinella lacunae]
MRTLLWFSLVFAALLTYGSCGPSNPPGHYEVALADSIFNTGVSYGQISWGLADTTAWDSILAAKDTLVEDGNYTKLRSQGIWYEVWKGQDGRLRANQPYPGWERRYDTIPHHRNILRLLDNERVEVDIHAADVTFGSDSFRIGIIQVLGRAFEWQQFPVAHPDYLILTTYGNAVVPIVMDQDNVGPITRKTVFRVGRNSYVLKSVAEDRSKIVVEALPSARDLPLAAELDLYFRKVPVTDLEGNASSIGHQPDKELVIYFWGLGSKRGEDVRKVDSLYRQLPAAERDKLDVVFVNHVDTPESIRTFVAANDIALPVYKSTAKTCLRLNCHPYLPYYVGVKRTGRISTYYGFPQWLEVRLGGTGGAVSAGASQ